jgi:hypothetical protein
VRQVAAGDVTIGGDHGAIMHEHEGRRVDRLGETFCVFNPGLTTGVGLRIQPSGINDLEVVDQICASSNPLISWLRQLDGLRSAAFEFPR